MIAMNTRTTLVDVPVLKGRLFVTNVSHLTLLAANVALFSITIVIRMVKEFAMIAIETSITRL
jgi:hypothetical protein